VTESKKEPVASDSIKTEPRAKDGQEDKQNGCGWSFGQASQCPNQFHRLLFSNAYGLELLARSSTSCAAGEC
jgi:hypothetical protein